MSRSLSSLQIPARFTLSALGIALLALVVLLTAGTDAASAQGDLIAYTMVDQWPERREAAEGLLQDPIDLDVAADGRVFVADPGAGGVHTLLPTGVFTTPFGVTGGYPAQLGQVGHLAVGPAQDEHDPDGSLGHEHVWVLDTATERVVVYDADGTYLDEWPGVNGESIAASSDGRVYVLDRETTQVRAFDAVTGEEQFAFGERGTEDGQFSNFRGVDVAPDGRVLAVTDKDGLRVQLFDLATDEELAADEPPVPATLRKVYDLRNALFNKGDYTCRGSRVSALGEDKVFVGEATTACLIDDRDVLFAIASSANSGTICRETVRLPDLRADTTQYFALAVLDPNSGSCGSKRTELETTPVVVRYDDEELRGVRTVWEAASNDDQRSPIMIAPEKISMPAGDVIFVQDSSSLLRFYSLDGAQLATAARDSSSSDDGTETTFTRLLESEGSETLGEVYAAYVQVRRTGGDGPPGPRPRDAGDDASLQQEEQQPSQAQFEMGVGRFTTVERQTQTGAQDVIEAVWTDALVGASGMRGGRGVEIPAIAFNAVTQELLVVQAETVEQQRTTNIVVTRYMPDGTPLDPSWDVPDDGQVNPYADVAVGPDGRVYLLDDLEDVVHVLEPDGTPAYEIHVAMDARSVAGGPPSDDGSVFVLREVGAIERLDESGTVTARLDGRPLAFSDPTTLTDLVVDGGGRVYVADGQSSLISVFEATDDPDVLPVPNDGECLFRGDKTADPQVLALGDPTSIELLVDGSCAVNEDPADIVVVAPFFGELQQGVDPSAALLTNLLRLTSRVDFDTHRVGLVSYYTGYNVDTPLTHDAAAYDQAVRSIQRFDPPNQDVKARLKNAMDVAAELYDEGSERRKVMVLVNALYCDPANERYAGQCAGYPPAEETAQEIRDAGVTIIVVQSFGASNLASSDEDFVRQLDDAHRRMVNYHLPEVLASELSLVDEVPANMQMDPASVTGGGVWSQPDVAWDLSDVDFDGLRLGFDVTPTQPGRWPTNVSAVADVVDGWGNSHRITFPVPEVEVIGPTVTPPPDVPTPTDVPPTPAPTATAEPGETQFVFLPMAVSSFCMPTKTRLDIVLAVDVSNSMGGAKLEAAKASVGAFLDAVSLGEHDDRVALVDFAIEASMAQGLTADRASLDAAASGLTTRAGTRIDRGITAALDELNSDRARSQAGKAIVLLSDGDQTQDVESARAAGRDARERGVLVYTIGLGADANGEMLADVAGSPERYFYAPSPEELAEVYAGIAASLSRCP